MIINENAIAVKEKKKKVTSGNIPIAIAALFCFRVSREIDYNTSL